MKNLVQFLLGIKRLLFIIFWDGNHGLIGSLKQKYIHFKYQKI